MQDLEIAKKRLNTERLTLSIVKDRNIIFESAAHGISGLLDAIEENGDSLEASSVADRIAGKAAALLCIYAKVKAVYAATLSQKAKEVLEEQHVYHEWDNIVENIFNADKTAVCPFEKLATETLSPSDAYGKLKALQARLESCR